MSRHPAIAGILVCGLAACTPAPPSAPARRVATPELALESLIPRPEAVARGTGRFAVDADAAVYVDPGDGDVSAIGRYLASHLASIVGAPPPVRPPPTGSAARGFYLATTADEETGDEGYVLAVTPERVTLTAHRPAGLFRGVQTLRQMLPAGAAGPPPPSLAAATIRDRPRFGYRGAMLDVARHFLPVRDVESFVDQIAYYKMNVLHLHLTDDQGWRIAVASWPRLTEIGGTTQVGGGTGAYFYSQADYREIVAYAASRYVTVVPEIDMPGHTNAALASYAGLNCDGVAPPLYTGVEVGFSSLCLGKPVTAEFVRDVIGEVSALTPGPFFHMGGDEIPSMSPSAYSTFVEETQAVVRAHGKRLIGWEEVAAARLEHDSVVQQWDRGLVRKAVEQGAKVIFSPSKRAYLDMKYDGRTRLGQDWAGLISVRKAYDWDPATYAPGVSEGDILGVEAPLWSETLETLDDVEFMVFPRLPGVAEIAWSPRAGRGWDEYRLRLATHGSRLAALGVHYFRSPEVPWM
jgi:hexosaminidase